jgi:hypothetical protein
MTMDDFADEDFIEVILEETDEALFEIFTTLDRLELLISELALDDVVFDCGSLDPRPDPPHAERMTIKEVMINWLHKIFMGITHRKRIPRYNPKKFD